MSGTRACSLTKTCALRSVSITANAHRETHTCKHEDSQIPTEQFTNILNLQKHAEQFINILNLQMHAEQFINILNLQMHAEGFTNVFQCTCT